MKLEEQVTSLELSRILKELGLPQESLWLHHIEDDYIYHKDDQVKDSDMYSAFTVAELGKMLSLKTMTTDWIEDTIACWYGSHIGFAEDTEADSRAKLLIHLIKEGIIKINE